MTITSAYITTDNRIVLRTSGPYYVNKIRLLKSVQAKGVQYLDHWRVLCK